MGMKRTEGLVVAVVRTWTRLYTTRLEPVVRDARRAEIESDLWEHSRAAGEGKAERRSVIGQILARCLLGVAADLTWRSQMLRGPGRDEKGGVPMNERIERNWWLPAPIALIAYGTYAMLIHLVGDGFESPWDRTAAGWDPSLASRTGAALLIGGLFIAEPIVALVVRRPHPGWTLALLLPWVVISLTPLMWSDAGWMLFLPILGIATLVGAVMNLAQRSVEEGPPLMPSTAERVHG
jgi:hypothetical protein